jgi:uncharacterized protein (DUF3820 family)
MSEEQVLSLFEEFMKEMEKCFLKMDLGETFEKQKNTLFLRIKINFKQQLADLNQNYINFFKEKNSPTGSLEFQLKIVRMKFLVDFIDKNMKMFEKALGQNKKKWWHII